MQRQMFLITRTQKYFSFKLGRNPTALRLGLILILILVVVVVYLSEVQYSPLNLDGFRQSKIVRITRSFGLSREIYSLCGNFSI